MGRARVLAIVVALAAIVAWPAAAVAKDPAPIGTAATLSGSGDDPDVAVDEAGTAHLVWSETPVNGQPTVTVYCRLPAGARACDRTERLVPPVSGNFAGNTDFDGPEVILTGQPGDVLVLTGRCCFSDGERYWLYRSADGGATFAAPVRIGGLSPSGEAVLGPGPFQVSTISDVTTQGTLVQATPLEPQAPVTGTGPYANLSDTQPYDGTLVDPDGTSLLAVFGDGDNLSWRRWPGTGDVNNVASWGPTTPLGPGTQSQLAGGPKGAYLLSQTHNAKSEYRLEVRRFTGMGFSAPVRITADPNDSAAVPFLTQDDGGGLYAVWRTNGTEDKGSGPWLSTSADGLTFTARRPLVPLPESTFGLVDAASADKGGVAVWQTQPGDAVIRFAHFDSVGSGPGAGSCPTRLTIGPLRALARQGCFKKDGPVFTTDGPIRVNGIDLEPSPGGGFTLDPALKVVVSRGGPVTTRVGQIVLDKAPVSWQVAVDGALLVAGTLDPVAFDVGRFGQRFAGLQTNGLVFPRLLANGRADLPLNLKIPSPIGGLSGGPTTKNVNLVSDLRLPGGVDLSPGSLSLDVRDVWIGIALVERLQLAYTSDPFVFTGLARVVLPAGGTRIGVNFAFQNGEFRDASGFLQPPPPGLPLAPGVALSEIRLAVGKLSDCAHPSFFAGGISVVGGPAVAGTGLIGVDGDFRYQFPEGSCRLPGRFSLTGKGRLVSVPVASLGLAFTTDGVFTFDASIGLDLSVVSARIGVAGGFSAGSGDWFAKGEASASLIGIGQIAGGSVVASNVGLRVCAQLIALPTIPPIPDLGEGGFHVRWGQSFQVDYPGCEGSVEDYVPAVFGGNAARLAARSTAITLGGGAPATYLRVRGTRPGTAPRIRITGPGGVATESAADPTATSGGPGIAVVPLPAGTTTAIRIAKPAAGTYTVTALDGPGTGEIDRIDTADQRPDPKVTGSVSRVGRSVRFAYAAKPITGQQVRILEERADGGGTILRRAAAAPKATATVPIGRGPAGRRTVVAEVMQEGWVRGRFVLGTYVAPAPLRPGAPRTVRLHRDPRGGLSVTWRPPASGASAVDRWLVRAQLSDGRQVELLRRAAVRRARFAGVHSLVKGVVTVRGVTTSLALGRQATARLRPSRSAPQRCANAREKRLVKRCVLVKPTPKRKPRRP